MRRFPLLASSLVFCTFVVLYQISGWIRVFPFPAQTSLGRFSSEYNSYLNEIDRKTGEDHQHIINSTNFLANTPTSSSTNITVLVRLRGELGNHIGCLLYGKYIEKVIATQNGPLFHVQLVAEHQDQPRKWIRTRQGIESCFPQLAAVDFEQGIWNTHMKEKLDAAQQNDTHESVLVENPNILNPNWMEPVLQHLNNTSVQNIVVTTSSMLLPHVHGHLVDETMWNIFNDFVRMTCCSPYLGDFLLIHVRNFHVEVPNPQVRKKFGLFDATPEQLYPLVKNMTQQQTPIRFLSRFPEELQTYKAFFEQHNYTIYHDEFNNSTGLEDFCLLRQAPFTIGGRSSTYMLLSSWFSVSEGRSIMYYFENSTNRQEQSLLTTPTNRTLEFLLLPHIVS